MNPRFSGREMAYQELGRELLMKVTKKLDDISVVEQELSGVLRRHLFVMLAPDAKKIKEMEKKKSQAAEAEEKAAAIEASLYYF